MTKIGCLLPLESVDFSHLVHAAQFCEKVGYDSIWAFDHLKPYWSKPGASHECWSTLSFLAARTENIRIGSLVANVNLRHPSILARITSTIDEASHGRLIVGLGTGDRKSRDELTTNGYRFSSRKDRLQYLRETIQILKGLWTSSDFSFNGRLFQLNHARLEPKPIQIPHPPIWIGGRDPGIIDIVAEFADGWNYWDLSSNEAAERIDYLRHKCAAHPSTFGKIVKSACIAVKRDQSDEAILACLRAQARLSTDYFIAYFGRYTTEENLRLFADLTSKV